MVTSTSMTVQGITCACTFLCTGIALQPFIFHFPVTRSEATPDTPIVTSPETSFTQISGEIDMVTFGHSVFNL